MGAGGLIIPSAGVTFDPANKATEIVLDGTQLIATFSGTAASRSVRGTTSKNGDYDVWFRLRPKNQFSGDCVIGLSNSSGNLNSYAGQTTNSIGLSASGVVNHAGATVGNAGALTFDGTKFYGNRLYSVGGVRTWEIYDGTTLLATIANADLPTGALYIFATLTRSTNEMVLDVASPQAGSTPWV